MTAPNVIALATEQVNKQFEEAERLEQEAEKGMQTVVEELILDLVAKLQLEIDVDTNYESNDEGGTDAYHTVSLGAPGDGSDIRVRMECNDFFWRDAIQAVCQLKADKTGCSPDIEDEGIKLEAMTEPAVALRNSLLIFQLPDDAQQRVFTWLDTPKILPSTYVSSWTRKQNPDAKLSWCDVD